MGYGDDIMATGLARGLHKRGKRAAFGDGKRIIWGPWSEPIFQHNPNIARPGSEGAKDLEWIDHYKGHRRYNRLDKEKQRWIWNYDFKAIPGEIFMPEYRRAAGNFIYVEPNVPWHKSVAVNKDWGLANYQAVTDLLLADGHTVIQSAHGRDELRGAKLVSTPTFRSALAILQCARAALVPEGGMHHAAAALGVPAVVIFGGFSPPAVTGYDAHFNLTGGAEACGSLIKCHHCEKALAEISVEEVYTKVTFCYVQESLTA
jgi:glycosyl transferase family 9 (putative heptosyltransferase)